MTSFQQLKYCDNKTTNLVNGYIHELQNIFPWKQNSYFIIPPVISQICLSFYWIRFTFDPDKAGENLEFLDDKTVTKIQNNGYSMCAIGTPISNEMCDMFRIEYHFKKYFGRKVYLKCPFIGFGGSAFIDECSSFLFGRKQWTTAPGIIQRSCTGFALDFGADGCIGIFNKFARNKDYELNDSLRKGDKIMLEFNFIVGEYYIYYNGEKTDHSVSFDDAEIIPLISLYWIGEVVEITKYEFSFVLNDK